MLFSTNAFTSSAPWRSATLTKKIVVENIRPVANFTYCQGIEVVDGDNITITLRVAGRKWQSLNMSVYKDDELIGFVNITREPGSPDEQAKNISIRIISSREYEIVLRYLSNGHGATPAWVTVEYMGITNKTHFVFNAPPGEEIEKTLDLDEILENMLTSSGLVKFDASSSYDPDGEIISYYWGFGDGETGEGFIVYHKYENGTYTATLTVTDNDSATNSTSATIIIATQESNEREIIVEYKNLSRDKPIMPTFRLLALLSALGVCAVMLVGRKAFLFVVFSANLSPIFAITRKVG